MNIFGLNAWKLNTAATVYHKHFMPTVKHGGEEVIIWTCFAATGPEHLAFTEPTMISS